MEVCDHEVVVNQSVSGEDAFVDRSQENQKQKINTENEKTAGKQNWWGHQKGKRDLSHLKQNTAERENSTFRVESQLENAKQVASYGLEKTYEEFR